VFHTPQPLSVVRSIKIPFIITLPLPLDTKFVVPTAAGTNLYHKFMINSFFSCNLKPMIISQSEPIIQRVTLKRVREEIRGLTLETLDRFTVEHHTIRASIFIYTECSLILY